MLKPDDLQAATLELASFYYTEFELLLPALNWPLLTFQFVKELALPCTSDIGIIFMNEI